MMVKYRKIFNFVVLKFGKFFGDIRVMKTNSISVQYLKSFICYA